LALLALLAPDAGAKALNSSTLNLSVTAGCGVSGAPEWLVVQDGFGYDASCYHYPRVMVRGYGLTVDEHFRSQAARSPYARPITPVRLDGSRPIKAVFTVTSDQGRGPITADFQIRVQNVLVATVRVEAINVDSAAVTKTFILPVPGALKGVRVTSADVATSWQTCIGPLACSVIINGPDRSRIILPTK
jgi:hypothetical protein